MAAAIRAAAWSAPLAPGDDYERYIWDGAVTAAGINPYRHSPQEAREAGPDDPALAALGRDGRGVLGRINHAHLRTIYPPVAQGLFAAAHLLALFRVAGLRIVLLAMDIAACMALAALLLGIAVIAGLRRSTNVQQLAGRVALVALLLSPTVWPWYYVAVVPLASLNQVRPLLRTPRRSERGTDLRVRAQMRPLRAASFFPAGRRPTPARVPQRGDGGQKKLRSRAQFGLRRTRIWYDHSMVFGRLLHRRFSRGLDPWNRTMNLPRGDRARLYE